MDLKNLVTSWKEFQKWLKEQGIDQNNIQQKIPEFVEQVKRDPQKLKEVQSILNNKTVNNIVEQLNINKNDVQRVKNLFESNQNEKTTLKGNLTPEQLKMLKKFKR